MNISELNDLNIIEHYQEFAKKTLVDKGEFKNKVHCFLGLVGEYNELIEAIKNTDKVNIKEELLKNYIEARVVSMPNMNLFLKQDKEYQEQVLPTGYRRMVIELSNDANWYRFISSDEDLVNIPTFGKSGSEKEVLNFFELDMTDLVIKIKNNL